MCLFLGAGLPQGVSGEFFPNPFLPGDTLLFQISGGDSSSIGDYPLAIAALAPSAGVSEILNLALVIEPLELPFQIQAISPVSQASLGASGVVFSWEEDQKAEGYYLQVASSPTFDGSIIFEHDGISTTSYSLPISLQIGTTYYWRVAGVGRCGIGPFGETEAFQTGICELLSYNGAPIEIPLFGNPATVTSDISSSLTGTVGSVQVQGIQGSHTAIDHLEMSLMSPGSTEVVLFSQICSDQGGSFLMNFGDNGLSTIACPPNSTEVYQAQGSFSDFVGQNAAGNWTLTIRDLENFEGGEVQNWGLEICESTADAPSLIKNLGLQTQQWHLDTIDNNLLSAFDFSGNLTFTILSLPNHGGLLLNGANISIGSQFSQQDIDQGLLAYLNNGSLAEKDSFRFDLSNAAGGWSGVYDFVIDISKNPNTGLEIGSDITCEVFPNPVSDELVVQLTGANSGKVDLRLFSIQGQLLHRQHHFAPQDQFQARLSTAELPAGLYLLKLSHPEGELLRRIVKH